MEGKLKLLFITASPSGQDTLRSDAELRDVDARIRDALPTDRFEIAVASAARRDELQKIVLDHAPDIVHFSGHGDSKRGIVLEGENGRAAPVSGSALAGLFALIRGKPNIVFLNACSTKRTARAFQHIVDYTIAMNGPIPDVSAIAFASAFYGALARGLHVPAAFAAGINQIEMLKLPAKTMPELFIAPGTQFNAPPKANEPEQQPAPAGSLVSLSGSSKARDIITVSGNHNTVRGPRR